jgi:hypothetical protein
VGGGVVVAKAADLELWVKTLVGTGLKGVVVTFRISSPHATQYTDAVTSNSSGLARSGKSNLGNEVTATEGDVALRKAGYSRARIGAKYSWTDVLDENIVRLVSPTEVRLG